MTKNPKLLIMVAAVLVAVIGYWMLVLAPKREQLATLDTQLTTAQAELDQSRSTLATYEKARGSYRSNYSTVVRLGKAVPADDDVRSLVVQLDAAAEGSGVDFDRITIGGGSGSGEGDASEDAPPPGAISVGAAGFTAMPFKFAFEGDFDNLSTFFSKLERFVTVSNERIGVTGRLLRLESLQLTPDASTNTLTAEIGASSYLLPAGEGLTGGGSATEPAAGSTPASAADSDSSTPPTTTATSTGALR